MEPIISKEDAHDSPTWTNHYLCPCGEKWEDQWDCACNDHCPTCDKEIEPYISDDGSVAQEEIDAAYKAALESNDLIECANCDAVTESQAASHHEGAMVCKQCQAPSKVLGTIVGA